MKENTFQILLNVKLKKKNKPSYTTVKDGKSTLKSEFDLRLPCFLCSFT